MYPDEIADHRALGPGREHRWIRFHTPAVEDVAVEETEWRFPNRTLDVETTTAGRAVARSGDATLTIRLVPGPADDAETVLHLDERI